MESARGPAATAELQELPFTPVHAPIMATVPGMHRYTLFLRCLWKRRKVVLEQTVIQARPRPMLFPPPHGCHPPPCRPQPSKDKSQLPPGICHPPWKVPPPMMHHPHGKCHPPLTCHPLSLWCVAMAAAKYTGLWGRMSSFQVSYFLSKGLVSPVTEVLKNVLPLPQLSFEG